MKSVIIFCGVMCLALAQQPIDDGDDGSYNPAKYEAPYEKENYQQPQQYQPQTQYQPQQYQAQPQQYQPQPQQYYQAQPQSYQPQQYVTDPKNAAILSEQRYLNGDGKFGASYTQDDGVQFKEEALPDGTRRGSYSYIDPTGQRKTVSYTAGKDGFQASGDHLPVGPAPLAPVAPVAPASPSPSLYQTRPHAFPQSQPAYRPQQPQQYQPQTNSINGQYSFDSRY